MTLRLGLIGCGNISDTYLANARLFRDTVFTAVSDLDPAAARAKGDKYGLPHGSVAELLGRDDVDAVVNLTIPAAHAEVSLAAIAAGKHVYTEKPLATSLADGRAIVRAAREKGVRLAASPDTILGAGVQAARAMIDAGKVGTVITGTASVLSRGMEHWHPNPGFFFKAGGGPVLDLGPYYIGTLVTLLGPVLSVRARALIGNRQRLVTAEGPMKGRHIDVEVPTTVNALLSFASGAEIVMMASWDVHAHAQLPIELHGTEASMRVPDPNFFGGEVSRGVMGEGWQVDDLGTRVLGRPNWPADAPREANYRGVGLADLGAAIRENRPHRANGDIALHTLAVMLAILDAAAEDRAVEITDTCERPAPLGEAEAAALLA